MDRQKDRKLQKVLKSPTWIGFIESTGLEGLYLNGVSVSDGNLDYIELDELIQEINA